MKLYSYIVTHDTGFSPNPFWGYCTLANCKPAIRKSAQVGDWVVGLSRKSDGNRLIYAMRIEEIISFHEYYCDGRFTKKIPNYSMGEVVYKCGDNIYRPLPDGSYQQLQSMHSNGAEENLEAKAHDLGGKYVLVSRGFYYFGSEPIDLPESLGELKVSRAHKCRFSPEVISAFAVFIRCQKSGVNTHPASWPNSDESWKKVDS